MNTEYDIKPIVLMTCNPSRGWLYSKFYKPWTTGDLKSHQAFLPATIFDNPHASKEYIENLRNTLSQDERDRMLHGKWEFTNDPNQLVSYQNALALYDQPYEATSSQHYITADIAFVSDKCLIILWKGLDIVKIIDHDKATKPETLIKDLQAEYRVQNRNVIYDATGAGLYLKNYLKGAYVFHSGAKPIKEKESFEHLKTQCYFKLAEHINEGKIRIYDDNLREELIDEVLQIKTMPKEKLDGKIKMIKKEDIKKFIGRSPDILDALAMRMVHTIKQKMDYYRF